MERSVWLPERDNAGIGFGAYRYPDGSRVCETLGDFPPLYFAVFNDDGGVSHPITKEPPGRGTAVFRTAQAAAEALFARGHGPARCDPPKGDVALPEPNSDGEYKFDDLSELWRSAYHEGKWMAFTPHDGCIREGESSVGFRYFDAPQAAARALADLGFARMNPPKPKVALPAPDADGEYRFGDGSQIWWSEAFPGKWVAASPSSVSLPNRDDGIRYFDSPEEAAEAMFAAGWARGEATPDEPVAETPASPIGERPRRRLLAEWARNAGLIVGWLCLTASVLAALAGIGLAIGWVLADHGLVKLAPERYQNAAWWAQTVVMILAALALVSYPWRGGCLALRLAGGNRQISQVEH